jgi:hypothetical protein
MTAALTALTGSSVVTRGRQHREAALAKEENDD